MEKKIYFKILSAILGITLEFDNYPELCFIWEEDKIPRKKVVR